MQNMPQKMTKNIVEKIFPRQRQAVEYLSDSEDLSAIIIAFEQPNNTSGKRSYKCINRQEFVKKYESQTPKHCYELLLETRQCRLYFDVEFYTQNNPQIDGDALIQLLIELTCKQLKEEFGIPVTTKNAIILDSSTPSKFSQHIIFHIVDNGREFVFATNRECGAFVTKMYGRLEEPEFSSLMIKSSDDNPTAIFDMAVYSRNRIFRLYKSSKTSPNAVPLTLSPKCTFYGPITDDGACNERTPTEQQILSDSLISITPTEEGRTSVLPIPDETASTTKLFTQPSNFGQLPRITDGKNHSYIDDYFEFYLARKARRASAKSSRMIGDVIVYEVHGYRFCHNIHREHKSNHVYWLADVARNVWYQKCHDPECRMINFRSNDFPLPPPLTAKPVRCTKRARRSVSQPCQTINRRDNQAASGQSTQGCSQSSVKLRRQQSESPEKENAKTNKRKSFIETMNQSDIDFMDLIPVIPPKRRKC